MLWRTQHAGMASEIFSGYILLTFDGQYHRAFHQPNAISETILALESL